MNTKIVRQLVGDAYNFKQLNEKFSVNEIANYKGKLKGQFSKLTKNWSDELHSEWTARMFLSAKMIYSSTLLLNTLDFSKRRNIRVIEPYLLYYSIFNCCRALTFSHPTQIWRNGNLISDSHNRVIINSTEIVARINNEVSIGLLDLIKRTKDYRELFSYKYPADGLRKEKLFRDVNIEHISKQCNLICEIAQFNSECFQFSFDKNCLTKNYSLDEEKLKDCFSYKGDNYSLTDDEDTYRISYIMRKVKRPYNIYYTMTEGMTDDFFGSWIASDEDDADSFDPDNITINIFDLP